jgi:hypothetical protein
VRLTYAGTLDRQAVVDAAGLVVDLVSRPEVAAAWTEESSCAGMTVGGLTRHLVDQSVNVVRLLGAEPSAGSGETIGLLDHYARAAWVREDVDGETNRSIRDASDAKATEGPAAAVALQVEALEQLPQALASTKGATLIPWQGWSLPTDDFLVTRLMEIVVHSDDLAASVGLPAPTFGGKVLEPVLGLLTALAVVRHGQDAVVRTLTRPQRAPGSIAAF